MFKYINITQWTFHLVVEDRIIITYHCFVETWGGWLDGLLEPVLLSMSCWPLRLPPLFLFTFGHYHKCRITTKLLCNDNTGIFHVLNEFDHWILSSDDT